MTQSCTCCFVSAILSKVSKMAQSCTFSNFIHCNLHFSSITLHIRVVYQPQYLFLVGDKPFPANQNINQIKYECSPCAFQIVRIFTVNGFSVKLKKYHALADYGNCFTFEMTIVFLTIVYWQSDILVRDFVSGKLIKLFNLVSLEKKDIMYAMQQRCQNTTLGPFRL